MNVIPLLVLCSLVLAAAGVLVFLHGVRNHDFEHADRLSLLPLEEDDPPPAGRRGGSEHREKSEREGEFGAESVSPEPGPRGDHARSTFS